jgi:hypothetical protein
MAAREEGSQQEHVAGTIRHIKPDYKDAQLTFGWIKASSITTRLGLLVKDTIYLFMVKLRCNTRQEAT